MTDANARKGWPRVFADGRGLAGALASIWEGASPAGMTGGHLRDLTADFLDQAGPILGTDLDAAATAWREAAAAWHAVAELALPVDVPEFARLRALTAATGLRAVHAAETVAVAELAAVRDRMAAG